MIDDLNQRDVYNNYYLPRDRVDGYTIKQLEDALIVAESWWGGERILRINTQTTQQGSIWMNCLPIGAIKTRLK